MKSIFFAFIVLITVSGSAFAQQASIGCIDKPIRMQAEDLKLGFTKHGMETYKDANISMMSGEPYPVAVQLTKGVMYQMIFVGSPMASDITLELFDGEDKKQGKKEQKKNDPNYIIFSFIPEKSDMYLVVLSQRLKNKSMCSSFTILQPASVKTNQLADQPGNVPSDNRYNNPRYIGSDGQKNTNTKTGANTNSKPANKAYQRPANSNAQQANTNPRYVAPQNNAQPATPPPATPQPKKTNEPYKNPRYVPQGK